MARTSKFLRKWELEEKFLMETLVESLHWEPQTAETFVKNLMDRARFDWPTFIRANFTEEFANTLTAEVACREKVYKDHYSAIAEKSRQTKAANKAAQVRTVEEARREFGKKHPAVLRVINVIAENGGYFVGQLAFGEAARGSRDGLHHADNMTLGGLIWRAEKLGFITRCGSEGTKIVYRLEKDGWDLFRAANDQEKS